MALFIKVLLFIHVVAGFTSLATGLVAFSTQKGGANHRKIGKIYFYAMTIVFVTAIIVSVYKFIPFLFMIAFLSYYSVFAGVRALKLKKLHEEQAPTWYDWFAGILNLVVNLGFITWGVFHIINGNANATYYLAMGFGLGGSLISYTNLKPFISKPKERMHWWFSHMGNIFGGYIATTTAFSTTIFGMMEVNHFMVWVWPALIGIPLSSIWQRKYRKQFKIQK